MYMKRNNMPKTWHLPRKGMTYIINPLFKMKMGIPLLILLRDMLKLARTRKEAKKLLNTGKIKINQKVARDDKAVLMLFDVLSLENKNLKLILKNKKFDVAEVKGKEAEEKIVKITGKKILKGKKVQINLNDGRNCLSEEKIRTGDSAVIDLKENKISEILPLKTGSRIIFIVGKYLGEEGIVEKIENNDIFVKLKEGKVNSKSKFIMVVR